MASGTLTLGGVRPNDPGAQQRVGMQRNETDDESRMVRTWLGRLEREKKAHDKFRQAAKAGMAAYEGGEDIEADKMPREPIWWSNTKVTQAAIFSRQPKPDVRRRVTDSRTDKNIALAVERALAYQQDTTAFDDHSNRAVTEFLAAGLGQTCVWLKEETEDKPVINPVTMQPVIDPESGQMMTKPVVTSQATPIDYIPWDLFRWEPAKDWEDVQWVSFDSWLDAAAIERKYRVVIDSEDRNGGGVGGDNSGDGSAGKSAGQPGDGKYSKLHLVHRIWDKKERQVITLCSTLSDKSRRLLKVEKDPYRLKDFYPCPRPMMLNIRSGKLCPKPEYSFVRGKCEEIDKLSVRIAANVNAIKDVGFYDASLGDELATLMEQTDGARVPVANLIDKFQSTSLSSVVITEDIRSKVEVVVQLVQERERAKQALFELTGIADIVRGATKASETATAQQLKSQWANVRLTDKMREVSAHFRAIFRIQAELISEHFEPAQITAQTGVQITPEMLQVMRSDLGRCYAIDIESDSTIAQDEQQEKQDRTEFIQAFTGFVQTVLPMQQQGLIPADLANAALLFFVGSFRHGRILEEQIETMPGTMQQLEQQKQQTAQVQQQAEQSGAQVQQMQQQMQQQADEAAKRAADLERQIADLTAALEAAKGRGDGPAKQMKDFAEARRANAQADNAEADAMLKKTQVAQVVTGTIQPGMV